MCHRKGFLWYSWKSCAWEYDIDKVLSEFDVEGQGPALNTSFITRRLQGLPPTARAILAWASLLGSNFSFLLVQRLLSGEFEYSEGQPVFADSECSREPEIFMRQPAEHVIDGLQASVQSYILVNGSGDDEFRRVLSKFSIFGSSRIANCNLVSPMIVTSKRPRS